MEQMAEVQFRHRYVLDWISGIQLNVRQESGGQQGLVDKITLDPLTMWAHHFTIFNIDCTKLTLKESNQVDADMKAPDGLSADDGQITFLYFYENL